MKHLLFTFAAAAFLGVAQAQVPSYVPTDGLVAWYPFDGDAHDESGNGNDAIESANANLMPSFAYDSHWNREVIEFDDVDDELTVLAPNQLGVGNEFSFSTWLVPNDQNHGQVMSMDAGRFSFFLHGADDHFDAISGTSWASEAYYCGWNNHPYVHPEGWFHMTITVSADSIKAFGNGQLIAVKDCGGQSTFDTNIIFGFRNMNSSLDYHWGGRLADCGIWNRALLPDEIAAMYQSEENPSIPGCMDEAACNFNPEATEDDGSCLSVEIETSASAVCEGDAITAQAFVNSVLASFDENYATVNETGSMLVVPTEYESVQAALSASADGDTILVMPGQYVGTYDFPQTHGVHLISAEGPSETVLDGNNAESVIAINGEFEYSVKGFTITRGRAYQYSTICNGKMGGGMEICGANTVVNVEDNFIIDNLGRHRGGGIRVASPNCVVKRNVIAFNTMPQGWATYDGGAGVCIQASDITFENNTVAFNNDSGGYPYGAGVHMNDVEGGSFRNNIIFHNQGGPAMWRDAEAIVPIEFCNVDQDISGEGNLNEQPLFVDAENYDFHLNGASPCIDAGDPSMLDSDGTVSDLGAFPFYQASPTLGVDLIWSTGDTTATIQIQPEESTTLEVQATLNGITCSASTEITVYDDGCADEEACNFSSDDFCFNTCIYPILGAADCDEAGISCGLGTIWDPTTQSCIVATPGDFNFDGCVGLTDLLSTLSAYNNCGSEYFTCGLPVTYQGYSYQTVQIGGQCWFAENLQNEQYSTGEAIPSGLDDVAWGGTTEGAMTAYGEGASTCYNYVLDNGDACDETVSVPEYGRLYNWHAVADERGLCPTGWHVPSDLEWMNLEMHLGMVSSDANGTGWRGTDQGTQLKSTEGWSQDGSGSNSSGFAGLPAGDRTNSVFVNAGTYGTFWSSSEANETSAWKRFIGYDDERVYRTLFTKQSGFSVRCIQNTESCGE